MSDLLESAAVSESVPLFASASLAGSDDVASSTKSANDRVSIIFFVSGLAKDSLVHSGPALVSAVLRESFVVGSDHESISNGLTESTAMENTVFWLPSGLIESSEFDFSRVTSQSLRFSVKVSKAFADSADSVTGRLRMSKEFAMTNSTVIAAALEQPKENSLWVVLVPLVLLLLVLACCIFFLLWRRRRTSCSTVVDVSSHMMETLPEI
jgi:hypothetical protein